MKYINGYCGKKQSKTYMVWSSMLQRILNPKNKDYHNYGGRGLTISKRWQTFNNFHADMGDKPKGLTLERVDNNKGYCKSNCIWATRKTQANNQRPKKLTNTDIISIRTLLELGSMKQKDIAKLFNVSPTTICEIKSGRTHGNN